MAIYVGVDIGTGGVRAVSIDASLEVGKSWSRSYSVRSPKSGWAEQDPDEIVSKTIAVMEEASRYHGDAETVFCFSSVMHSVIAVDADGSPVSPMLIWADNRAIQETKWLEREYGTDLFYKSTACPLHPSFWPGKIIWLGRELGAGRIARYVSIKEYLLHRVAGVWLVDESVAGSSGLFGLEDGAFDRDLLQAVRVSESSLSKPVSTRHSLTASIGGRQRSIVVGSTDGVLANLGIGAVRPDTAVLTVGSSAAVRVTTEDPVFDNRSRSWCYRLDEDHYVTGEASNSGGLVLNWLASTLGYESAKAMTTDLLPVAPYDPVGPLLLPTLSGERAPGYQEELRGELIDIALNTTRSHLVTAAVEGVALFSRMIYDDLVRALGSRPDRTIVTGTLGKAKPIAQLAPRLFGPCYEREELDQSSAVGAALLAVSADTGESLESIASRLPPMAPIEGVEDEEFGAYLDGKYERFAEAYHVASGRIQAVEPMGPDDPRKET